MKKYAPIFISLFIFGLSANAQTGKLAMLDSGKNMHFVSMADISGQRITPGSLKGKMVVMNFWFLACPPCRYEIPQLSKIADDYKNNQDVVFIAVSTDSVAALKEFMKTNAFDYRMIGNGKKLQDNYGINTCPLSLVIDKNGVIIYNSYTERHVAAVAGEIADILKGHL